MSRKVCIVTFGCQMNKLDSELVAEALVAAGHELVPGEAEADVVLFNTCSVRDNAEQRVLSRLMQFKPRKREEPGLLIGVMGCFAQRLGAKLFEEIPHLDIVCGTRRFPHIAEILEKAEAGPVLEVEEESLTAPGTLDAHGRSLHDGIQAYVSVMRGCNNFCTYCIVPYVRGREESRPVESVVEEVRSLAARGAKEVTLLGQNIDAYGKDINSSLAELLEAVHEIDSVKRFRYVTSHPRDITEELLKTINRLPRACKHLHMPAQSGSSRILKAMNRGYTREDYDRKLAMINEYAPGVLVTSDFIVGFPGETDEDFSMTVDLVEKAKFQSAYIFKYSPRPGTKAEQNMADDVAVDAKKERNQILLATQEKVSAERSRSLVGSRQEVLVEGLSKTDKSKMAGRTKSNLICVFDAPDNPESLVGELLELEIKRCTTLTLYGDIVDRIG
ncbi:MAG: tRNA (N6-isopentenyl adenosine(37)-C2)-methylthiotransferase MiaB [Planctomycetes bacterium]|nr:tRNA (N6-isopentenyl adenosine(37)-C2)-methylthiotransferase MiaB [Planctomycetota bacterium]